MVSHIQIFNVFNKLFNVIHEIFHSLIGLDIVIVGQRRTTRLAESSRMYNQMKKRPVYVDFGDQDQFPRQDREGRNDIVSKESSGIANKKLGRGI